MLLDGVRGYLALATGLGELTRDRARAAARAMVAQGEAGAAVVVPDSVRAQVSTLTEDLLATSKANRDLLVHLVRGEVERSVHRLGLVTRAELEAAARRADRLERRIRELETTASPAVRGRSRTSSTAKTAGPGSRTSPGPRRRAGTSGAGTSGAGTSGAGTSGAGT